MEKNRIIYGIDLGTTNSAIARFENGTSVVKKSNLGSDTTPSCVAVTPKGRVLVGHKALGQYQKDHQLAFVKDGYTVNSFVEFKRLMGTDEKFHCSYNDTDYSPEELSSEVLKELRRYILDDEVKTAVITVPAMFDNNQKDATKRAAQMAGFDHFELIQEPVAASIAYGIGAKSKNSYWLVFDLGGGTFDVALMHIEDGIMKAIDTAGNNKLGGKDIDATIVRELIIPKIKEEYKIDSILSSDQATRFCDMWKPLAEEAKIQLSFNPKAIIETDLGDDYGTDDDGNEIELCLTITADELERVETPLFQKAIDLISVLLERNNLTGEDLGALVLVGGPTHSPVLRKMLSEQVCDNVDTSIDPMTCVAVGAAIYASTIEVPEHVADQRRDVSKVQLALKTKTTSVEEEEFVSVRLLLDKSTAVNEDVVYVVFKRNDGAFSSSKIMIDTIGDVIEVPLNKDCTNSFTVECYNSSGDRLECEPNSFSIIQGIDGIGDAVMPLHTGIGVSNEKGEEVFAKIDGLEKGHILPSDGMIQGLHTSKDIRAGFSGDEIRVSIYQTENYEKNTKVIYCNRQYDVVFTGDDIPDFLPRYSEINIRMQADKSGTINKFIINIPYLDLDIDVTDRLTKSTKAVVPQSFVLGEIKAAKKKAEEIDDPELKGRISSLEETINMSSQDRDTVDKVVDELKDVCRKIDDGYNAGEWERMDQKVRRMFRELEEDDKKYGTKETHAKVEKFRNDVEQAIKVKNIENAEKLYHQMWHLDFQIAELDYYTAWIYRWNANFDNLSWQDKNRARGILNTCMAKLNESASANVLRPMVMELNKMLPMGQRNSDILSM